MQASNHMSMEVSGNVCTCMQFLCQLQPSLVTSPHVSPSEKRKWVGSGDETNYSLVSRPPPDFISQLCCFCLFVFCLFLFVVCLFVCLFFPRAVRYWDLPSNKAS